jgi:DNA-binding transcriptional LysR family regulator
MQLRDLELFCEVANLRSFSKAAKSLGISQPVASETVKALEDRLGLALVNRSKRPLELTHAGEIFAAGGRDILEQFRQLEDRVLNLRDKVVGPVRVAAIYSVGLLQMDCYVKQFEHLYPDAALELKYLHPNSVLEAVVNDEADFGLTSYPPKRSELVSIPWQDQEMVVVLPPMHRLAPRKMIQVKELDGEPLVSFTPELQIRVELDRWLKQAKIDVDVVHEFDNIETIKRAVEVGSGIGILPAPTVKREQELGSLKVLRLEDVRWTRPLGIIHRKQKVLSTACGRFLDLLHQPPETFFRAASAQEAGGKRQTSAAASTGS